MTIKGKRGTVTITVWSYGKEIVQHDVSAMLYGPYWAVLYHDHSNPFTPSLIHIPTGMRISPPSSQVNFSSTEMKKAARALAEQGDSWNFGRETMNKDGKSSPEMRLAYDNWQLVCRALWPELYPTP